MSASRHILNLENLTAINKDHVPIPSRKYGCILIPLPVRGLNFVKGCRTEWITHPEIHPQ